MYLEVGGLDYEFGEFLGGLFMFKGFVVGFSKGCGGVAVVEFDVALLEKGLAEVFCGSEEGE